MEKNYKGKNSPMAIAALICSLLCYISIIGLILGIIDLTKKDGRKKGISLAAIIIGGVMTLLSIILLITESTSDTKDLSTSMPETVEVDSSESIPVDREIIDESRAIESQNDLVVKIEPTAIWEGNGIKFDITTNLPDESELMLTLSAGDFNTDETWRGQTKVTINNGFAESDGFSQSGDKLSGDYDLCISMSLPSLQSDAVRAVIGEQGEHMTGPLVDKSSVGDSKVVTALFSVTVGDIIAVTPEDDYTHTIFRSDEEDDISELIDTSPDEDEIKSLIAAAEVVLKKNFGDNYNISYEGNAVTINLWQPGITAGAVGVKSGTVSKSDWNYMVGGVESMSNSVYKYFKPYGIDVIVNVLNDVNKENTLLSFIDGVKFYDILDD